MPPQGVRLRAGQLKCLEYIRKHPQQASYLFQLPTGYGKTYVAAIAIQLLREQSRAKRFVVVVPNTALLSQMVDDQSLQKACEKLGVKLSTQVMSADEPVLMQRLKTNANIPDVIVTTVQGLSSTAGQDGKGGVSAQSVREFCRGADVAWICDEAHHYGASNIWGQSIAAHKPTVTIGLSATPIRGDKKATIFGSRTPDVEVEMAEAVAEKAVRPIKPIKASYEVEIMRNGEIISASINEIVEEAAKQGVTISEWEMKNDVRYLRKYIQPILNMAIHDLIEANANLGKASNKTCHQLIVYCISFKHAMAVADIINQHIAIDTLIHGLKPGQKFAEVISDGVDSEGEVQKLSPAHNADVMSRFNDPNPISCLKCVVCVNKLSEGYDNSRVSHIALLNLIKGDKPTIWQMIGRALRWNMLMSIFQNVAMVYAGVDHPLWGIFDDEDFEQLLPPEEIDDRRKGEPKWIEIKDADRWRVHDVTHLGYEREDLFMTMGNATEEECVKQAQDHPQMVAVMESRGIDPHDDQAVGDLLHGILSKRHAQEVRGMSEKEEREIWRQWNSEAAHIFIGNIHRRDFRGAEEKSQYGDTCKRIMGQLKRYFKKAPLEMEISELQERYKLIQKFNNVDHGFPEQVPDRSSK